MNIHRILTNLYGTLGEHRLLHPNLLTPFRIIIRRMAWKILPYYYQKNPVNQEHRHICEGYIASLTSFPGRIDNVYYVVESLLRQSCLPEKIILWLSKNQFELEGKNIPIQLSSLQGRIFLT